jgi:hypothetical protein
VFSETRLLLPLVDIIELCLRLDEWQCTQFLRNLSIPKRLGFLSAYQVVHLSSSTEVHLASFYGKKNMDGTPFDNGKRNYYFTASTACLSWNISSLLAENDLKRIILEQAWSVSCFEFSFPSKRLWISPQRDPLLDMLIYTAEDQ